MLGLSRETQTVSYHRGLYRFRDMLEKEFGCPLERLHERHIPADVFTRETDQSTPWHKGFYDIFDPCIKEAYLRFVKDVVFPAMGEDCVFQRIPTFRVHYPDNVSAGEFHKDTDYNHPAEGLNVFVPLTVARASSTIWVAYGRMRMPMDATDYGEAVIWDGANKEHGNVPNVTGYTRVSFDLRVIPESVYIPRPDQKTINTGMRFEVGEYYARMMP